MGILLIVEAAVAVCVLTTFSYTFHRWIIQRPLRIVPGIPSPSFITGNLLQMFTPDSFDLRANINRLHGKVVRINGALGESQLVITDTKALHHILIKDPHVFEDIDFFLETNRFCLGPGLLATQGAAHKRQRKLLNPAFATGKIRRMVPQIQSITMELQKILRKELANGPKELDVLQWTGRLALELIAQAGMGHTFHALQGENSAFAVALKDYFPAWSRVQVESRWLPTLTALFPRALLRFLADHAPWADVRRLAQISDTLYAVTKEIWEAKKARTDADTLGEESDEGRDLMSILLKANDAANEEDRLPDDELLAQMSTFLFAGTDTTSSALARILHMLCLHPDAQEELREELVAAGGAHGALDYDALHGLSYLDAVCRETLRLFPPVSVVQRIAQTDTLLPLSAPILGTDNRPHTTLAIPNRTGFVLNVLGVNRDPDIWGDDADEWKPERWRTGPLPESVGRARVPGVYANQMTFISGPRACIGFQFALLEMKIVLAQLIPPFRFFLPTQKDIIWRCGAIVTPVVAGAEGEEREKPAMPLRVSLA